MADTRIEPDAFEELVADVLDSLPDDFRARMENVEVVVEEWPTREQMRSVGLRPGETLFGLYQGTPGPSPRRPTTSCCRTGSLSFADRCSPTTDTTPRCSARRCGAWFCTRSPITSASARN